MVCVTVNSSAKYVSLQIFSTAALFYFVCAGDGAVMHQSVCGLKNEKLQVKSEGLEKYQT